MSLNPLGWFKVGGKAADAVVGIFDGIKNGADMLVLTEEEKIQYNQGGIKLYHDFLKLNMDQNSLRSKARREIAILIVQTQALQLVVIGTAWIINKEWALFMLELNTALKFGAAFLAVIVFYFGYYGVQGAIEKFKKK